MTPRARLLLFPLEDLRAAFAPAATPGADPRHDTAPFRAFRAALLDAAARCATGPATLSFAWEGTFNGYALLVVVEPADALAGLEAELGGAGAPDGSRVAAPPSTRYPLAAVEPARAEVARDASGATFEAPFGAPTGHFGAPGVRRIP